MFPRWLTFITESDGRTLNETNGVVSSSNARTPLQPTADVGEIKVGWERDNDLLGLGRLFSFPVSLYRSAAKIARNEFYKKNVERKLFFLLTKLTLDYNAATAPAIYKRYYRTLYKGEIDFPSIKDGDTKISFNLHDGGTDQQLKAKKDTVYEISMDDPEAIWVKMDGVLLQEKGNLIAIDGVEMGAGSGGNIAIPVAFVNKDGQSSGIAFFGQELENNIYSGGWDARLQSINYLADASDINTGAINAIIKGELKVKIVSVVASNVTLGFRFVRSKQLSANQSAYAIPNSIGNPPVAGSTHTIPVDLTIPLEPGEKLFFEARINLVSGTVLTFQFLEGSNFSIEYENKYKTTFVRALLPETVNKRLVKNITGSEDKASSALIAANNNLALSCINAVRGLEKSVMKTKYSDFFRFCKVQMVAALGIENDKIVIEEVEHFLTTATVEDLGTVKDLEITYDTDRMANTYEVGYEEKEIDNVNGKFEFNNKYLYESSITKVVKKYELICPYGAGCYWIETKRINLDGKTTTDDQSDNDVCILDIDLANPQTDPDLGTYYNLRRVVYDNWNDPDDFRVPSPSTVFNVEIRPEVILQKHAKWINSMMYGFDGEKLVFRTTQKNTIKTKLGSVTIDGKSDYVVVNNRIFIPRNLSFDSDIDSDLIRRMQTNSNRCFKITDTDGTTYTGFPWRFGVEPDSLKEQPFVLLSTKDNNFLKRIR